MSNGKGDSPRPLSVNQETFASNWDRIFSNDDVCQYSGLPTPSSFEDLERDVMEVREKIEYMTELKSGMFWERYPNLSGEWETDRAEWMLIKLTDMNKELQEIKHA